MARTSHSEVEDFRVEPRHQLLVEHLAPRVAAEFLDHLGVGPAVGGANPHVYATGQPAGARNLMGSGFTEFGFYTFVEGFGFITKQGSFSWENRFQNYNHKDLQDPNAEAQLLLEGHAYMQEVFADYLAY